MSAVVEETILYGASCSECMTCSDLHEDESMAYEWAANHDAENHAVDDGDDAAFDHYKESDYELL